MNRKIRVIILTMVLTVLMFGGTRLMAEDNLDVNTTEASQTETPKYEGKVEPMANGEEASSVEPGKNADIDGNEANDDEVNKTETTEGKPEAKQEEKTEAKTPAETPADKKADNPAGAPAKAPEKPEEPGTEDGSTGDGAGKTPDTGTTPTEGKGTGEGEGTEPKKPTPEVNPDKDKDLSDLKAEIDKEQDPKKKAELQKEYNEKYLEKVEADGKDKLDPSVQDRLTDAKDIKAYNDIMDKQKEIQKKKDDIDKKIAEGISPEEIDALYEDYNKSINEYNELIGSFKPPRVLSPEEKKVRDALDKDFENFEIPGVKADTKDKVFETYQNAKKALEDALDPNEDPVTPKKLEELKKAYKDARAALKQAIDAGTIEPKYTADGNPEVRVYPLDGSTAGKELDDDTYYIPDKTNLNLLIEVRKDDGGDFTFTIKPNKTDPNIPDAVIKELKNAVKFKDGSPVDLTYDAKTGTYSFTTSKKFEIAQIQMNLPAFRAAFHEGFEIEMQAGSQPKVTKKFLITKKGYDDADIGTIGTEKPKDPQEIDGGDTTDGIVDEDTKKVYDIFAMIKETDGYIDDVIVNSANGESLPLSSVDITITLPKYNQEFADYLYNSGLKYDLIDAEKGQYRLKLDTKVFGGNLIEVDGHLYRKDEDGNKTGEALTAADLKGYILEEAGKKVYVDESGTHAVTTEEYYELKDSKGNVTFVVQDGKLHKKKADGTDEWVKEFKNGKLKDGNTTYVFSNGKLISYTDEKDLFEGNVSNKNGEANLDVTPTYEGDQVIVNTTVNEETKQAYGGTIIKDGIFDKDGKYTGKTSSDTGYKGYETAYVDANGKRVDDPTKGTEVPNAVFNKEGFIVSGLTFKKDFTLIDKFGKIIEGVTVDKSGTNYTFAKEGKDSKTSGSDGITVETGKKFVGNDNYIVDENGYVGIVGKYYYDGKKFEKVEDNDNGIKGKKYYKDYNSSDLEKKKVDTYKKDANTTVELHNVEEYHGSIKPEDYVSVGGKTYVKKQAGSLVYYVGVDADNQVEVLSKEQISKIVQIFTGADGKEYEKLTDETDIAQAVKNAKFQIKFPRFLAGKDIVYKIHADIKANYLAPGKDDDVNETLVSTSIFKDKDGNSVEVKKIDKYFTLKVKEGSPASFFKNPPKELLAKPDYNFFNIFYRDETDRDRDEYIKHLLEIADDEDAKVDPENKSDMTILNKIQSELGRLYNGAKFALVEKNDKKELVILDKNDEEIKLDRSLLWEVGFNNPDGALFPENKDSEIIIEDHNMDNRLIYDEIIVNDTQDKWNELNKEYEEAKKKVAAAEKALADNKDENAKAKLEAALEEAKKELEEKKFKGNDQYFFIDQIKDIRFGVNPNYIDGRFVPLGENFKITGQEIIDALDNKDQSKDITDSDGKKVGEYIFRDNKHFIKKGGIEFEVRRDDAKGQIRIKVMNAFYKKVENDPTHKFESPVQEDYQKKIDGVLRDVEKLALESDANFIKGLVEKLHAEGSDCFDVIKEKLTNELDKIKAIQDTNEKNTAFDNFKKSLKEEIQNLRLEYLDKSKHKNKEGNSVYKYDDMRFNAIRIGLKPGLRIGGPTDPVQTKKLGITSVIIPEVDIPYTDEFGDALTNKDKYVQEAIGEVISDNNFITSNNIKVIDEQGKPIWNKVEDSFKKVMKEAYRRVNEKIDSNGDDKIKIEPLVTVKENEKYGQGKYTVIAGNSDKLSFDDLANGDKALTDSKGQPLNPYYVVDKDGKAIKKDDGSNTTIADKITDDIKGTDAYKEFISRPIDIAGYYMSKLGYNGAMYANFANYKLVGGKDQAPGIFGKEDDWHKKICYPGLGSCIEDAGGDKTSDKTEGGNKYGSEGEAGSEFELTYTPTPKTPDEEHPKVDKKSETDKVDVTKEPDKTVDFTIDVTVDKLKKDQKELSEAVKENPEDVKDDNYDKKTGYYIYRDGLIIDFLPDIFEFTKDTEISVKVNKDSMRANGANANLNFETFQNGIKYVYTEDVKAYLAELKTKDPKKAAVLEKALDDKIKDGQRAVIAWLPEFEGPHGAKNQFTMTLTKLLVNKEKYKESEENKNKGQAYINEGGFGDEGEFFFGTKTITVTDGHNANVNKYLQLLDKDGKVIPQGEAGEWFKGSATLKFGDKFNYKIKYYLDNKGLVDTGFVQKDREWKLEDLFNGNKGLLPVLRDFVKAPEGFTVTYKVGKNSYTEQELKAAIEKGDVSLAKVDGILINPPEAGFPYNEEREFILPMMIPEIDAKIEDGNVVYVAKDGTKKILGKADEFFNLGDLTKKDAKMYFENKADKSNTVTVYLDKERFIKLYKEFFDANGNEIKKDRPEVKFDIYQIIKDEDGNVVEKKKLDKELTLNEANDFVDQVNHLPLFKRIEEMDEKGNVTVKTLSYTYEVKEQAIAGYTGKVFTIDDDYDLGFVLKAKNYEKPEEPEEPEEDEPKEPEEPEEDEPKEPKEEEPHEPEEEHDHEEHEGEKPHDDEEEKDLDQGKNKLPKTGIAEDLASIYFAFVLLLGLVFIKKRYLIK